jgi:Tol biopolymer transport system component
VIETISQRLQGRPRLLASPIVCALVAVAPGCGQGNDLLAPLTGELAVTVRTEGDPADPNGYLLVVDTAQGLPTALLDSITVTDLALGEHELQLQDMAPNCTVAVPHPRTARVVIDQVPLVEFVVTCRPDVGVGALRVAVKTSGTPTDEDGYLVAVDPSAFLPVPADGEVVLNDLAAGDHAVRLSGLSEQCFVSGENPAIARVPAGGVAEVAFAVACWPLPEGRIAFSSFDDAIWLATLDGSLHQNLSGELSFFGALNLTWSPSGSAIAFNTFSDSIFALDVEPDPITGERRLRGFGRGSCPTWSPDGGRLMYARGFEDGLEFRTGIFTRSASGTQGEQRIFVVPDTIGMDCPRLSPDGQRIAFPASVFSEEMFTRHLMLLTLGEESLRSLTTGESLRDVNWSPDSRSLAYVDQTVNEEHIYTVIVDGGLPVRVASDSTSIINYPSWSPDGTKIAFSTGAIVIMNADGTGRWQLSDNGAAYPAWAP